MKEFDRGISDAFVNARNGEYNDENKQNNWWRKVVDNKDLFIGVRDEYVDVYYNGGRVLKLKYARDGFTGETHFKYFINQKIKGKESVKFRNGEFDRTALYDPYRNVGTDIEGIKEAAEPHQDDEKKGVHKIIMGNTNVIDTEIAFPGESGRIDFAALQMREGRIWIVFFEAKTYSNNDIRSAIRPRVLDQLDVYKSIISKRKLEIEKAYRQVARNIKCLEGWRNRRSNIFAEAATSDLAVDPEVRLVIFGFKDPQKKAADAIGGEFARLRETLGKHRVLTKGDPDRFIKGIKSPE